MCSLQAQVALQLEALTGILTNACSVVFLFSQAQAVGAQTNMGDLIATATVLAADNLELVRSNLMYQQSV